jgi:hypothetical protein
MSDAGSKVKLWDGIIEYEEAVPDARTKAVRDAIEAGLTKFETHKEALLANLHDAYQHGQRSEPFDAGRSWRRLTSLAGTYFWEARIKKDVMPDADRTRLRNLAKALGSARTLVDEAIQSDVGNELCGAWWEGTSEYAEAKGGFVDLLYIEREFRKVTASLAALETAASRAADDIPPGKRGRPPILPEGYIEALAGVYRASTGLIPMAGGGPFTKFIIAFLTAIGRYNQNEDKSAIGTIKYDSVIDAIKDARAWSLMRSTADKWELSPFAKET